MSSILQGSEEWKQAKQSKISASEIYSLVHHYCAKELQALGFDLVKERPFRTVQEMFLKVKFDAKLSAIDPIHSEFGNGMESYIAYRLGQKLPQLKIERSKEFILNEELHPLAACSPDGYIVAGSNPLDDFDKTCKITNEWGEGALELKTANYFANFDHGGPKGQYLFQLQYQMMVMGLKWGMLAVLIPKQKEYDEPFFKGQVLQQVKTIDNNVYHIGLENVAQWNNQKHLLECKNLNEVYDLTNYIYPELPAFQAMILKALNAFQSDHDGYDQGNQSCFPRNNEDLTGLQREKQLWGQLWPEKFGSLVVTPTSKLDQLLNDRYQAQVEMMFAEQNKLKLECEINDLVKKEGLGKYTELKGTEHRLVFIKNGQQRFYRNNNKI